MKKSCEEYHRIQISGLISDEHIRCFLKHFILSPHYYMCVINRKFVEFDSEGFGQYYSKRVPQRELVHQLTCLRSWWFSGMYSVCNAWLNAVLASLKSGELGRRRSHLGEPGMLVRLWTQLPRLTDSTSHRFNERGLFLPQRSTLRPGRMALPLDPLALPWSVAASAPISLAARGQGDQLRGRHTCSL